MKTVTIIKAMFSALLLSVCIANAQTNVSGGIYTNTIWTKVNSPYIVTDTVVVFPNVTLTIEPGVEVRFDDTKKLEVRGHLNAAGIIGDSIVFTSSSLNPVKGSWQGIDLGGATPGTAIFDFCIFEYAVFAVDIEWGWGGNGPISVSHSRFSENERGTYGYGNFILSIDNCYFEKNGTAVSSAYTRVTNSTFVNNTYGAYQVENLSVFNSSFCGHDIAIRASDGPIRHCTFNDNNVAIEPYFPLENIDSNIIVGNLIGVKLSTRNLGINNTICNNTTYNVQNQGTSNLSITNNCWCSTDSAYIASTIEDGYDNVTIGLLDFSSFINCDSSAIPTITDCSNILTKINNPIMSDIFQIIKIYPNPVQNNLKFSFSSTFGNSIGLQYQIINTLGAIVSAGNTTAANFNVDVSALHTGVYFIRLNSGNAAAVKRFVKE